MIPVLRFRPSAEVVLTFIITASGVLAARWLMLLEFGL